MRSASFCAALVVIVASCGGSSPPGDPPAATGTAVTAAHPAFLTIPLMDARTGERFTLGGFPGKVTFAIAMAVW